MNSKKNMSGTPWHTEVLRMGEFDSRRHRSRCIYYRREGKFCTFFNGACRGSAHCDVYSETKPYGSVRNHGNISETHKKRNVVHKNPMKHKYPEISELLTVGDEVKERYYEHGTMRMRNGIVAAINGNKVTIQFKTNKGEPYRNTYLYPDMMKDIFIR